MYIVFFCEISHFIVALFLCFIAQCSSILFEDYTFSSSPAFVDNSVLESTLLYFKAFLSQKHNIESEYSQADLGLSGDF